jgi:hypothetical protein
MLKAEVRGKDEVRAKPSSKGEGFKRKNRDDAIKRLLEGNVAIRP